MHNLSALQVKNAKPKERRYKLNDGDNLFLVVDAKGGKWWRMRYWYRGKEKSISLGTYPAVSLAEAREKKQEIRRDLAENKDPTLERKRRKLGLTSDAPTVEFISTQWLGKQNWKSNYKEKVEGRLRRHIYPHLGDRPIDEVTPPELLAILHMIEETGTIETARRCKQHMSRVYRYARAAGLTLINPAEGLEEAMAPKPKPKHFAAITDPVELAGVLRNMYSFKGTAQVTGAMQLLPLLMLRPGELVSMEWSEWKQEDRWEISGEKMKMGVPHMVPLPRQAITILKKLREWSENSRYVFPSVRSLNRHITVDSLTAAFRRMEYTGDQVTSHGFRATARTLLDEVLHFRVDLIEHQLAHAVRDPNGRAYNRTSHLEERRKMMQAWADYLDSLRLGKR